jgi:hypothetical protein
MPFLSIWQSGATHCSRLTVFSPLPLQMPPAQEAVDGVVREMPASFLCPLSKKVMTDPVLLVASGHTYERAALAMHFAEQVRHLAVITHQT